MPLTAKGNEIKSAMEKEYGAKKGESVFYASKNKGTIAGVDSINDSVYAPKEYEDGIKAGVKKAKPEDNPHPKDSDKHKDWERGRSHGFRKDSTVLDSSGADYAKKQFESGKFPNINIDGAAGRFWLCDNDWKPFSDKHYDSRPSAEAARSKLLDKGRKFIKNDSAEDKAMSNQTPGFEKAFDALNGLMDSVKQLKSRVDARCDAFVTGSREFHELAAGHAKKTASAALEAGDPGMAKKWVNYGTAHAKRVEDMTPAEKAKAPPK